jgi:hypothetical protein
LKWREEINNDWAFLYLLEESEWAAAIPNKKILPMHQNHSPNPEIIP